MRSRVLLHGRGKISLPRRRVSGPDGSDDVQAVLGGTLRGERFETAHGMHLLRGGKVRGERRGDRLFELSVRDFREQLVQHGLHPLHRPERADVWEKRTVCGGNELFGLQRVHGRMHGRYMSVRHGEGIGTLLRGVRRDVRHLLNLHDVVLHQLSERILSESGRVLLVRPVLGSQRHALRPVHGLSAGNAAERRRDDLRPRALYVHGILRQLSGRIRGVEGGGL